MINSQHHPSSTSSTTMYYNIDNTASTSTSTSTFSSSSRQSAVPRLTDLCKRVLKANVAHIVDVGDVPYEMVKDILFGCRVEQLREIEELSPHIAEEDEEVWEYFFKRDFPIVAEARAKAAAEAAANKKELETTTSTTTSKASQGGGGRKASPAKSRSVHRQHAAAAEFRGTNYDKGEDNDDNDDDNDDDDDGLFMSYRDLYYDEQVRREEKLASAGERLKERMNNLAAMKSSRQTILDPRLSLNLRKKRRGQTLPTGRRGTSSIHWSNNRDGTGGSSRPKTLTEKARARASQLAFAYEPPRTTRFTRSASMQVGFIPSKPRPLYKEGSLEDVHGSQVTKGIFGPRRDRTTPIIGKLSGKSAITQVNSASHPSRTSFVERTVSRPAKSSMERPHKSQLQLTQKGSTKTTTAAARSPSPVKSNDTASANTDVSSVLNSDEKKIEEVKFRNIPGITRRPLPAAKMNEKQALEASSLVSPTKVAMSMPAQAGSPPAPLVGTETPPARPPSVPSSIPTPSDANADLPMLSQPVRKKPPGPSLFIPRKKPKIS